MWEDESNKKGGRWILQAGKSAMIGSPGNEQPALDLYWLEVNCVTFFGDGLSISSPSSFPGYDVPHWRRLGKP